MIKQPPSKVLLSKNHTHFVRLPLYLPPPQSKSEWELHVMECDVSVEAIIQDNSREHVAMVTEDKSVVTTNGEETVA